MQFKANMGQDVDRERFAERLNARFANHQPLTCSKGLDRFSFGFC